MEFTGERYVPNLEWPEMAYEHWHRYLFATQWVEGQVVLDIASGEGYGSHLLADTAKRVVGVDSDPAAIAYAASAYQRSNLEFLLGSAGSIPVEGKEVFDVVVSFETIEHLDEAQQAAFVTEVKRLLKESGVFLVSTPDRVEYDNNAGKHNPFHRHEFSKDEFFLFLNEHFSSVILLGQHVYPSSYIWPLTSSVRQHSEYQLNRSEGSFSAAKQDSKQYRYLIAACANVAQDAPEGSILLDISESATADRHAQLMAANTQLNAANAQLGTVLREQRRADDALYQQLTRSYEALLDASEISPRPPPLRLGPWRDLAATQSALIPAREHLAEAFRMLEESDVRRAEQGSSLPVTKERESAGQGLDVAISHRSAGARPSAVDASRRQSGSFASRATEPESGFPRQGSTPIPAPAAEPGRDPVVAPPQVLRGARQRKILYVVHNHPSQRPGGAQQYALELYEAMRETEDFEPIFFARDVDPDAVPHPGTPIRRANRDPNQYLIADPEDFDWFYMTSLDKTIYTKHFRQFLLDARPDVVHFLHTAGLGFDLVREVRNTLPDAPILYTLMEFLPICHRQGQMVRTMDNSLCREASPTRCHECFPDISTQAFFMRQRLIQSHLGLVDLFLAASHFLLERYVEWGIPQEKIRHLSYGRPPVQPIAESDGDRPRNRLGFFGQVNPYKGVLVLLDAMRILAGPRGRRGVGLLDMVTGKRSAQRQGDLGDDRPEVHLWLHGAYLEQQEEEFRRAFAKLLAATKGQVTVGGQFDPSDLPRLMANVDWVVVPSIWWENSPLVLHAAFQHGRPVICSDIGSLAENVSHGINGLHFRVGDSASLAETIRYAVDTSDLWQTLRRGIPEVQRMDDHVTDLSGMYRELLAQKVPAG